MSDEKIQIIVSAKDNASKELKGRLTRDPESRKLASGQTVTTPNPALLSGCEVYCVPCIASPA